MKPLGAGKLKRRGAPGKHRIGEDAQAVDFEQNRGMEKPRLVQTGRGSGAQESGSYRAKRQAIDRLGVGVFGICIGQAAPAKFETRRGF